jgi:peptide/nickel transport system ATP-binding protein
MSSTPAPNNMAEPLLSVRNLNVAFGHGQVPVRAVRDVSFDIGREKVAIVGESGSGKSTVGRSLLKLHPRSARVSADRLQFQEVDIMAASEKAMLDVRGKRISMILQDPKYSLNPVMSVGDQIAEAYRVHHKSSRADARDRAMEMLKAVRIRNPEHVYDQYPHQISGGMGQRVMIAAMLIPEPQMIIADEPTSALDVTIRLQVLAILDDLVAARGLGLVFITHDLNLVRSFCDRVLIMYAGRVVESLAAADLDNAQHPYTKGLLASLPVLGNRRDRLPVLQRDPSWLTVEN